MPTTDERLNKNYDLTLEVLSPLHIGAGSEKSWFKGMDFFTYKGEVYVIDRNKLYRQLYDMPGRGTNSALDNYTDMISKGDMKKIEDYILRDLRIDIEAIWDWKFDARDAAPTEIRPLIRNGYGEAYIPGSSIKGAIRSALFAHLYRDLGIKNYTKDTQKELLGDFENAIMRYIRPYDADLLDPSRTELSSVQLFNLYSRSSKWESEHKKGFSLMLENFCLEAQATFRLSIADAFIDKIEQRSPKNLPANIRKIIKKGDNPIDNLFRIINEHTKEHIQRELAFFKKYNQASDTKGVIKLLEGFKKRAEEPAQNTCILRMGYGLGYHGITGDYRFEDHCYTIENPDKENKSHRYKSRRLAGYDGEYDPMGFVKLSY